MARILSFLTPRMFQFLKKAFWNLACPWPDHGVEKHVRNLRFCPGSEERFLECVRLLQNNEAHGVPSNHRDEYLNALRSRRSLTVIAEDDGKVVGTFGLQYGYTSD